MERRASKGSLEEGETHWSSYLYCQNFLNFGGKFFMIQSGQHSRVVSWSEDGTHFAILDVERFEQ
jgi:hypothetical protein